MPVSHTGDAGSNPARGAPRCDRGVRSEAHGVASAADRVRVPAVALDGAPGGQDGGLHPPERGSIPRGSTLSAAESLKASPVGAATAAGRHRSAAGRRHTLSDAPGGAARLSPGWGGFDSRRERLLVVAQRIEHHPATVGDGGSNPPGEIRRRRAGWAGAALIWRSSVVRFHGRRSPRSSAEEQRASTPRAQVRALPGSSEVTGRRGDGHPTDFGRRRSQVRILPTRSSLSRESDAR